MSTHALVPTVKQLCQLRDGKLSAFLQLMVPQPRWETEPKLYGTTWRGRYSSVSWGQINPEILTHEQTSPYATGDEIVWLEEWWKYSYTGTQSLMRGVSDRDMVQKIVEGWRLWPPCTMPLELVQYQSVITECRPVKLCKLRDKELVDDWQAQYPKHSLAKSWAWWIKVM